MLKLLIGRPNNAETRQSKTISTVVLDGFTIRWQRSSRRKRSLALKLDKSGHLVAMTPMRTSQNELSHFVRMRRAWIEDQLAQFKSVQISIERAFGQRYSYLGELHVVRTQLGPKAKIVITGNVLEITSPKELDEHQRDRYIKQWMRERANKILPARLALISRRTGLQERDFQIKSYTARWGSCRSDGLIQLNWKLIMLPQDVIDYVIVHELCHLKHFDHSARFWSLVENHCSLYQQHRHYLRQNNRFLL